MTCLRRITIFGVVVYSLGIAAVLGEADANSKIADNFKVTLVSIKSPAARSFPRSPELERADGHLQLNCEIVISDPNLVLGISRRGRITRIRKDGGETVDVVEQKSWERTGMSYMYHTPRYRRQFVAPQKPPRWKKIIRSILRLPPPKGSVPKWSEKLVPSSMTLELDSGLIGPDSEKLDCIEGCLYVIMAESFVYVDVPFKPSKEWVRLTADLEIRVLEAQTSESHYNFRIETRRSKRAFRTPLSPVSDLPDRFPVDRQLLGKDGKSFGRRSGPIFGLASVGGTGSGSGTNIGLIEKIRFVIAVNPTHHKIPFVLKDIPLPKR